MKGLNTVVVPVAISRIFLFAQVSYTFCGIFVALSSPIIDMKSSNVLFSRHSPMISIISSMIFVIPFALGPITPLLLCSSKASIHRFS
jgi:hypothetical protein